LSHSSCSRRIVCLEKENYIIGYGTLTNREKLGYWVRVLCGTIRETHTPWNILLVNLEENDDVESVFAVSGNVDILLEISEKICNISLMLF